jgi:hypothetical protein
VASPTWIACGDSESEKAGAAKDSTRIVLDETHEAPPIMARRYFVPTVLNTQSVKHWLPMQEENASLPEHETFAVVVGRWESCTVTGSLSPGSSSISPLPGRITSHKERFDGGATSLCSVIVTIASPALKTALPEAYDKSSGL